MIYYCVSQVRDFCEQLSSAAGYDLLYDLECPKKCDYKNIRCVCCDCFYKCLCGVGGVVDEKR